MKKQQGVTFISFMIHLVVLAMVVTLVFRVIPVYVQHYSVTSSMSQLKDTSTADFTGDAMLDSDLLKKSLLKRIEVNGVDAVNEHNVTVQPKADHTFVVTVKYQVIKSLFSNVSLLFDFDDTTEVKVGS